VVSEDEDVDIAVRRELPGDDSRAGFRRRPWCPGRNLSGAMVVRKPAGAA